MFAVLLQKLCASLFPFDIEIGQVANHGNLRSNLDICTLHFTWIQPDI